MTTIINYYILDRIEEKVDGVCWGYLGDKFCEIFPLLEDSGTDAELVEEGLAKCNAPDTATFLIYESDVMIANEKVELL